MFDLLVKKDKMLAFKKRRSGHGSSRAIELDAVVRPGSIQNPYADISLSSADRISPGMPW